MQRRGDAPDHVVTDETRQHEHGKQEHERVATGGRLRQGNLRRVLRQRTGALGNALRVVGKLGGTLS